MKELFLSREKGLMVKSERITVFAKLRQMLSSTLVYVLSRIDFISGRSHR